MDPADEPGSGGVAHRTPVDLLTGGLRAAPVAVGALAAALITAWLIVEPRTPDLAGQVYRVGLFRDLGFAIWDEHWYAGHYLPGYSLLFPPLGALLGVRALGALAALASALLFERILAPIYGSAARWGALWFAVAAVGDIWIGRVAFAGFHYITAITKPQIDTLLSGGVLQMALFDDSLCEVEQDSVRYVLRRTPVRAEEIAATRVGK